MGPRHVGCLWKGAVHLAVGGVLGIAGCIEPDPTYVDPETGSGASGSGGDSGADDGADGDSGAGTGGSTDSVATTTTGAVGSGSSVVTTPGTDDPSSSDTAPSGVDTSTSGPVSTTGASTTTPPMSTTGPVTTTLATTTLATTTAPMTTTSPMTTTTVMTTTPAMTTTTGPPPEDITELEGGPGLNETIPDAAYDGSLGSMWCRSANVPANGVDTVAEVTLEIGIDHPWLGDLVIKVVSAAGTIVGVLSRAGTPEPADDGAGQFSGGIQVQLVSSDPIAFNDSFANDAELMGMGLTPAQAACRDDALCDYFPNGDSIAGGGFDDFVGESAVGQWTVCVGDSGEQDVGTVDYAKLTIRQVQ